MTNFFSEKYRPEICHGLHKWCCEQILRHLRLFRAKKFFFKNWKFFDFFAYPGLRFLEKWPTSFFRDTGLKFFVDLQKWCCERIIRRFGSFRAKKIFFKNLKFFDFFCISRVTDFLKNDQLLFWEIPAWNFSWTAQMVLRTNYKAFWLVSSEKNFFENLKFFDFFCISGVTDFLKNDQLLFWEIPAWNFFVDCTNGVANEL